MTEKLKKMRRALIISIANIMALLIVFGCAEDRIFDDRQADGVPPAEVSINEIIAGAGKVTVKWILPIDEDFLYVKVTYSKDGEDRVLTYSKFNQESIVIPNLRNEEYSFTFQSVDESGSVSEGVIMSATPLKPAYKKAAETVTATPTIGAINFNWENPTGDTLLATVYVVFEDKDSIIDIRYTGQKSTLRVLAPAQLLNYKIEFKDPELNNATSETIEMAAFEEIQFDRTRFNSYFSGYSPFTRVFDGQLENHFAVGPPFPRTIPFFYDKSVYVSRILFYVSRKNEGNIQHFPERVEIWVSETGLDDDYTKQGTEYVLKQVESDNSDWFEPREVALENVPKCRYIKLVINSTYSNGQACVIGGIEVFGAEVE